MDTTILLALVSLKYKMNYTLSLTVEAF